MLDPPIDGVRFPALSGLTGDVACELLAGLPVTLSLLASDGGVEGHSEGDLHHHSQVIRQSAQN